MIRRIFVFAIFVSIMAWQVSLAAKTLAPFTVRKLYVVPLVSDQSPLVIFDTRPVGQQQHVKITYITPVKSEQFLSTGDGIYRMNVPVNSGYAFIEAEYGFISVYTNIMGATISAVELNTQHRIFNGYVRRLDGNTFSTGIALVNPVNVSTNFTLWVKKEGNRVVAYENFRIHGGGQRVFFLHELMPNLPEGEFSLSILGGEIMSTPMPGVWDMGLAIAAVSYNPKSGLYETVPVKAAGIDK